MTKRKTNPREWLAFNAGILVFTLMWYGFEVVMFDFPVETGMFLIMFGMNFLAGVFGRIGLWMYHMASNNHNPTDV